MWENRAAATIAAGESVSSDKTGLQSKPLIEPLERRTFLSTTTAAYDGLGAGVGSVGAVSADPFAPAAPIYVDGTNIRLVVNESKPKQFAFTIENAANAPLGQTITWLEWSAGNGYAQRGPNTTMTIGYSGVDLQVYTVTANVTTSSGVETVTYLAKSSFAQGPWYSPGWHVNRRLDNAPFEAEMFDWGGEGNAYHDTDAANIGGASLWQDWGSTDGVDIKPIKRTRTPEYRVSDIREGEWLEYTFIVQYAGTYQLDFRVANTASGGKIHAEVEGENLTGSLAIPNTKSFNTFRKITSQVELKAGWQTLRISMDQAAKNGSVASLDWFRLRPVADGEGIHAVDPSDVGYVRDGSYAKQVLKTGGSDLQAMLSSKKGQSRETYLKFDLSAFVGKDVTAAQLRLYTGMSNNSQSKMNVQVFALDETFDSATLTWNHRPNPDGVVGGYIIEMSEPEADWYSVNMTETIQSHLAAGQTTLTIVIRNPKTSATRTMIAGAAKTPVAADIGAGPQLLIGTDPALLPT